MSPPGEVQAEIRARAFAPGHATLLFRPARLGRDPRARGSIGAGIVLDAGAWAEASYRFGGPDRIALRSDGGPAMPISRDVLDRLGSGRPGELLVTLRHELPIGRGFGMSAAGALATALSTASVLGIPRRRAVEVAHLADLFGGGGLGGVAAILGGGLEIRERPGLPPWGRIRHAEFPRSVFLLTLGRPWPTRRLLADPALLARIDSTARPLLAGLPDRPDPESLFDRAEAFTDRLGLSTPRSLAGLRRLRASGARVAQAMFGESLVALPPVGGARAGFLAALRHLRLAGVELGAARSGAYVRRMAPTCTLGTRPGRAPPNRNKGSPARPASR